MIFTATKIDELKKIAQQIIALSKKQKIILFYGKMGAGKTTLIKEICNQLNVTDNVTSPTFSIINEYETKNNNIIYHFDFYRIENVEELQNIGIEEYFFSGNICLIEWPQIIDDFFDKKDTITINISVKDKKRIIEINY